MQATGSLLALLLAALPAAGQSDQLGQIDFPNSGNEAAQQSFLQGVLLLHSFEYADSAEAFAQAQQADPDFALAYWGEALTHQHPLWNQEDRDEALAILQRLGPTTDERLGKAPAGTERGLLNCVEVLFGEGPRRQRLRAYSTAMGALHHEHPDDLEVQSLYALSILGTADGIRDFSVYMRAAGVAEQVYAQNPRHPGALHYLIHCYDDPVHAPLGLRQARHYDTVAPAAAHALHMPSHIYVALGLWEDSVKANVASAAAADARRERKQLTLEDRGYHAHWWQAYSQLQLGRFDDAAALLERMVADEAEASSRRTRYHLAVMRAAHLIETRDWQGFAANTDVDISELNLSAAAAHLLTDGMAALERGDLDAARAARLTLNQRIRDRLAQVDGDETKDPSTGRRPDADPAADALPLPGEDDAALGCCAPGIATDPSSPPGRRAAFIMEQLLSAQLLLAEGDVEQGLSVLSRAIAAEDGMAYDFGPPTVVKPAHELMGEVLLGLGRADEAIAEFEAALARAPRRGRSLQGLARAAELAGKTELLVATRDELAAVWHGADGSVLAELEASGASSRAR